MPAPLLLLFFLAADRPAPPMPPPPAGMQVLKPADKLKLLARPAAPQTNEGDDDQDLDNADSQDLEAMRALEQVVLDPNSRPTAAVLQSVRRLGLGNPLKARVEDGLEDSNGFEPGADAELPLVKDALSFDVSRISDDYDIPVEMQPLVAQYIDFFRGPGRRWFCKWMSRSSRYIPLMAPILESQGVPRDLVYLSMIESGFSTQAYSWAKAAGPWQFISATGKHFGLRQNFWVDERKDPVKATAAAAAYLKQLKRSLGDWYLAWAAYNAGGGRVRRVIARRGSTNFWVLSDGKGLAEETRHYVPKLIAAALVAKHPHVFGFKDEEFQYEPPQRFDEVEVTAPTDLEVIARAAEVQMEELKELNPELRRWCTPPASAQKPYLLRLPSGAKERFAANFAKVSPKERLTFKLHRVHRGDTLSGIARSYHTAPDAILQLNGLKSPRGLRVNAELVIPLVPRRAPDQKAAGARRSGAVAARAEMEAPAGAAPRIATADQKPGGQYAVADGDSLWAISQRFHCSVDQLRKWNHLSRQSRRLQVGHLLTVRPSAHPPSEEGRSTLLAQKEPPAGPESQADPQRKHVLAAGETLWGVAQAYGIRLEDLRKWNDIKEDHAVRAGQLLFISAK